MHLDNLHWDKLLQTSTPKLFCSPLFCNGFFFFFFLPFVPKINNIFKKKGKISMVAHLKMLQAVRS